MKIFISVLSSYLQCDHVRLSNFEWLTTSWSFVLYHKVPVASNTLGFVLGVYRGNDSEVIIFHNLIKEALAETTGLHTHCLSCILPPCEWCTSAGVTVC